MLFCQPSTAYLQFSPEEDVDMSGDRPKCHQLKAGIRATLVEMSMDRCIVGVFSAFLLMGAVQRDAVLPESQGGERSAAPGFMSGDQLPALAACHRLAPGCRAVVTADGDPADWSVPTCHGRTWQELSEAPCYRAMFRIDRRFGSSPYRWRASIRNWEPDTRRELIRRRLRGQG